MAEEAMTTTHVLLFPFPAQGHVPPMLKLGELLTLSGLSVTFLNTEHIHERLLHNSPEVVARFGQRPNFRFLTIPDGLPKEDPRSLVQIVDLEESLRNRSREPYRKILAVPDHQPGEEEEEDTDPDIDSDGWPPITCVIADGILPLALEIPQEMGIPVMLLRTSSASSLWTYYCIPNLIEKGDLPMSVSDDANMDELVQGVPGMESFLRRRDLPGLMRDAKSTDDDDDDRTLQYLNKFSSNLTRGKALILNTYEFLESPVLSRIRSICPITYTVGPLHLLLSKTSMEYSSSQVCGNSDVFPGLWKQDRSCIAWLDSQPPKSVVYVSFGSVTVVPREELIEFWHGLINSGYRFLWVVRPDLVEGTSGEATDDVTLRLRELKEESKERGYLVSWSPQEEVLSHPAVGCFLTHSGWNSTLESIVKEVPMICWPFFADQQVNSRFVSQVWKIGVDMKDMSGRTIVEKMVRRVMDDEEEENNKIIRRSLADKADLARKSTQKGGSSYTNFQMLVQHIKSYNKNCGKS